MQGRGRGVVRTGSCVNTRREEADAGEFATYSVQAPRWQTMATYHRGLPARERVIGNTGAESTPVTSDKEAGRQNKLQSLPLTRIAGRNSPQAPLHSGFIRPQTGKIAAQDQPTNQNLPPGLARECLGSACSCLTSQPLLPAPGRFAEQIRT